MAKRPHIHDNSDLEEELVCGTLPQIYQTTDDREAKVTLSLTLFLHSQTVFGKFAALLVLLKNKILYKYLDSNKKQSL